MRSVRLSEELESKLERASKAAGLPVSEFIRQAVEQKCDETLGNTLDVLMADVIGMVDSGGRNLSRNTGREFKRLLMERRKAGR